MAILAGCAANCFISQSFRGEVHSDNTELFPINLENCPTVIEDKYYLSELPEGFEIVSIRLNPFSMTLIYENKQTGKTITFNQMTKPEFTPIHYNTEKSELVKVEINGYSGVFLDISNDKQTFTGIIWDNGDYILELFGDMTKNNLINLANSAKISEN